MSATRMTRIRGLDVTGALALSTALAAVVVSVGGCGKAPAAAGSVRSSVPQVSVATAVIDAGGGVLSLANGERSLRVTVPPGAV